MFVDTSVIVAILADEPDAAVFATKLADAPRRYTSGLVILEAAMRLSTLLKVDPVDVEVRIQQVLEEARISVIPINGSIAKRAVAAFAIFGKGRGHPAQLNLADCMSYACARAYRVPLLFKGNDFSQTDIEVA
ncbi:MAG: type II toxin-antitoxin system VapC family toxin [Pseudomonadota bacterium]|jgi:ribonuclease VapC